MYIDEIALLSHRKYTTFLRICQIFKQLFYMLYNILFYLVYNNNICIFVV